MKKPLVVLTGMLMLVLCSAVHPTHAQNSEAVSTRHAKVSTKKLSKVRKIAAVAPKLPLTLRLWNYPLEQSVPNDANFNTCGATYYKDLRHNGSDLKDKVGLAPNTKVYTIGPGKIMFKSGPGEEHGWGIGNYALVIKHSGASGDFMAVYGHIHTSLNVGDTVTWGQQLGTVVDYNYHEDVKHHTGKLIINKPHLHFGIYPKASTFPGSYWGRLPDVGCKHPADLNGFVKPITFINNEWPKGLKP